MQRRTPPGNAKPLLGHVAPRNMGWKLGRMLRSAPRSSKEAWVQGSLTLLLEDEAAAAKVVLEEEAATCAAHPAALLGGHGVASNYCDVELEAR